MSARSGPSTRKSSAAPSAPRGKRSVAGGATLDARARALTSRAASPDAAEARAPGTGCERARRLELDDGERNYPPSAAAGARREAPPRAHGVAAPRRRFASHTRPSRTVVGVGGARDARVLVERAGEHGGAPLEHNRAAAARRSTPTRAARRTASRGAAAEPAASSSMGLQVEVVDEVERRAAGVAQREHEAAQAAPGRRRARPRATRAVEAVRRVGACGRARGTAAPPGAATSSRARLQPIDRAARGAERRVEGARQHAQASVEELGERRGWRARRVARRRGSRGPPSCATRAAGKATSSAPPGERERAADRRLFARGARLGGRRVAALEATTSTRRRARRVGVRAERGGAACRPNRPRLARARARVELPPGAPSRGGRIEVRAAAAVARHEARGSARRTRPPATARAEAGLPPTDARHDAAAVAMGAREPRALPAAAAGRRRRRRRGPRARQRPTRAGSARPTRGTGRVRAAPPGVAPVGVEAARARRRRHASPSARRARGEVDSGAFGTPAPAAAAGALRPNGDEDGLQLFDALARRRPRRRSGATRRRRRAPRAPAHDGRADAARRRRSPSTRARAPCTHTGRARARRRGRARVALERRAADRPRETEALLQARRVRRRRRRPARARPGSPRARGAMRAADVDGAPGGADTATGTRTAAGKRRRARAVGRRDAHADSRACRRRCRGAAAPRRPPRVRPAPARGAREPGARRLLLRRASRHAY